jgi:NTE family protein
MPADFQSALLAQLLERDLGALEPEALALLRERLSWVELGAGQTLMAQGEPGASMYWVVSGRLRAYVRDDAGSERAVRDMGRGQVIGEMSLYTDAPRSATVVAVRDSVLVQLDKPGFHDLLARSSQASLALARQLIHRMQTPPARAEPVRPVTMGLLPISPRVDAAAFAEALAAQLQPMGRVCVVDAARLDDALGTPGLARDATPPADAARRIALWLDELESRHDMVLLVGDATATAWSERCCRRSDELLLLAHAGDPPVLHATETQFLVQRPGRGEVAEVLLLLHPPNTRCPRGTAAWLQRRPLADHVHLREGSSADMARLARIQNRSAVGLVLAGGGARGLAHLGVMRALREHGIEFDFVGGTSIGSVVAALAATDRPVDETLGVARRAFALNPTGDVNWVPLLSLIRGRRLRRVVDQAAQELLGTHADIEDLWKNFFCVASNYSRATEQVLQHGPLARALLASTAIPGALPPVLMDGELLCDGGTFNNFPVDVMRRRRGVGRVIGVDLAAGKPRPISHAEVPDAWALLRDRLRPRRKRRYRFPSLVAYLMNVTILYSSSRQREAKAHCDLYFNPPLYRVGMLQWSRFDSIVEQGYRHASEVLDKARSAAG